MYVKLDKQNMSLTAVCGILETYTPSAEVKEIHAAVDALKLKMDKFMTKIMEPELARIQSMIDAENSKFLAKETGE